MKIKALAVAAVLLLASSANAATIAGWNFGQYQTGFISDDPITFNPGPDQLGANFSDLDTDTTGTTGLVAFLGDGSEAFGTWYIDGSFGSFDTPLDFADPFVPTFGNLNSNQGNTLSPGMNFSNTSLAADGQVVTDDNRMVHTQQLASVFEADLSSVPELGSDFVFEFGGILEAGTSTGSILVEVSTNGGASFSTAGTADLTDSDALYSFALGGTNLNGILVRITADGGTAIDNATISATLAVPEPGTLLLGLFGIAGLGVFGRRRN